MFQLHKLKGQHIKNERLRRLAKAKHSWNCYLTKRINKIFILQVT